MVRRDFASSLFDPQSWGTDRLVDLLSDGAVIVLDWRIDCPAAKAEGCVSSEELQRASRFCLDKDRTAFLVARAGLRSILAEATGHPPLALQFSYGANGKPLLTGSGGMNRLRFNLSHAAGRAMLALAQGNEVGIDCEGVPLDRSVPLAIAPKCFAASEQAALEAASGEQQRTLFYRLWTQKEAVIKLTGEGLQADLQSFETPVGRPDFAGWVALRNENPLSLSRCWVEPLPTPEGLVAAIATAQPPKRVLRRTLEVAR